MKLTKEYLIKLINEEKEKFEKERLVEGTEENPIQVTPQYLNQIIIEEYNRYKKEKK